MSAARDRGQLEVLTTHECLELLASQPVGRVGFVDSGEPAILPVNYALDGDSIVFRTAPGVKLSAAIMERPVAFEVDNFDVDSRTGWSVLVHGWAQTIDQSEVSDAIREGELEPWSESTHDDWVRINANQITGRRIPPHTKDG